MLTRLIQLALRWIFDDQPIGCLRTLLALIEQVQDKDTAVAILESLLRYYVQGTQRIEEHDVRELLQQSTSTGDPIMQTFIEGYIEQGVQQGGAAMLLRLIERRFGPPSEQVRERVTRADPNTLLQWSDRILDANSLDDLTPMPFQVKTPMPLLLCPRSCWYSRSASERRSRPTCKPSGGF